MRVFLRERKKKPHGLQAYRRTKSKMIFSECVTLVRNESFLPMQSGHVPLFKKRVEHLQQFTGRDEQVKPSVTRTDHPLVSDWNLKHVRLQLFLGRFKLWGRKMTRCNQLSKFFSVLLL